MNLLPHKSWHIWRRDNIAKIEKDEAKYRKELEEQRKIEIEKQRTERLQILRERAGIQPKEEEKEVKKEEIEVAPVPSKEEQKEYHYRDEDDKPKNKKQHVNLFAEAERNYHKAERIVN